MCNLVRIAQKMNSAAPGRAKKDEIFIKVCFFIIISVLNGIHHIDFTYCMIALMFGCAEGGRDIFVALSFCLATYLPLNE